MTFEGVPIDNEEEILEDNEAVLLRDELQEFLSEEVADDVDIEEFGDDDLVVFKKYKEFDEGDLSFGEMVGILSKYRLEIIGSFDEEEGELEEDPRFMFYEFLSLKIQEGDTATKKAA